MVSRLTGTRPSTTTNCQYEYCSSTSATFSLWGLHYVAVIKGAVLGYPGISFETQELIWTPWADRWNLSVLTLLVLKFIQVYVLLSHSSVVCNVNLYWTLLSRNSSWENIWGWETLIYILLRSSTDGIHICWPCCTNVNKHVEDIFWNCFWLSVFFSRILSFEYITQTTQKLNLACPLYAPTSWMSVGVIIDGVLEMCKEISWQYRVW